MQKSVLFIFFITVNFLSFGQGFYDLEIIQTIEITFAESNWDQLLDNEKAGDDGYIMAQSVTFNGEIFDSVGVKYKGNSTYNRNQTKNPFHIELDTYKNQDYEGYKDIKLSNVAKDPSFVREVLSYQILRQYMDAPLSNYANVFVNGTLIGLYSNSEAISKTFLKTHFDSKKNTFIKCNPPAGAGPQSNDFPNLVYLGEDSTNYYNAYEMKSDNGWEALINLCDSLENNINEIEKILDVDRTLWMLAFDNILVNLDSYIGAFAQNYYLYKDDYKRFLPIVWDLNESFGAFSMTGSGNLNSTADRQQMNHLLNENDTDFPMVQQLLNIPMYKRMYLAHCKTILLENFDNNTYFETAQALQTTIDAAVQADENKFYTYNNFLDNLTTDIGGGAGPGPGQRPTPGITILMDARSEYLLALNDFTQTAPTIDNIELSNTDPIVSEKITIAASIQNADMAYLGYRIDEYAPFTRIEMFDDGLHNDGVANDGVFATDLLVENAFTQYYIYAENNEAGMFSPQRAEYEYHSFTATTTNTTVGDLVINEFMADNDTEIADQAQEFDDWIELFNNSNAAISLDGYYLSDDPGDLMQWQFPAGTNIDANDYLIVWADDDTLQTGLHANFKLSSNAESIVLVNSSGDIIDEISYTNQATDISFARKPNGTGSFEAAEATFNANNDEPTSINDVDHNKNLLTIFPNPTQNELHLNLRLGIEEKEVNIYNLTGKIVYQNKLTSNTIINVSNWVSGIYLIKIETELHKFVVE